MTDFERGLVLKQRRKRNSEMARSRGLVLVRCYFLMGALVDGQNLHVWSEMKFQK